jgi:DNA-binding ferritin-like protein
MAQAMQQLQQQAAKLGKDLAEQLKNGQAQAAQATLEKMVQQLKQTNLSQEQLQKILDEVSKAVDPASPYGKAAQYLKDATQQMQQGQKPDAAQSLAAAAKELEKLAEQLGDAQALADALDALNRAQMAIAMGKSWSECKGNCTACNGRGCSVCLGEQLGWNHGGKPGRGVGTWAEESGWLYYPEVMQRWDNTGIDRPDMAPRGQTDRGDGALSENVAPTKIKGQISPGGQMPSITLKGVSIKGQSGVAYQEAVAAAQSEAQSALNQDRVPRAYQGAVKDYFDDLKKQ